MQEQESMTELLETSIKSSIEAGKKILDIYGSGDFGIEIKKDNSPLTEADIASNNVIIKYLEKTGIPVLSEESSKTGYSIRKEWKRFWLVDPLDGTKEFIKRNGEFTVNIALIEDSYPVMGVIYAPVTGELYYGDKENGSFRTKVKEDENTDSALKNAVRLPAETSDNYTLVVSRSHMNDETEAFVNSKKKEKGTIKTLSRGSSLKICMVAEGKADCYPRFGPTMEWDTAAGHAIAKFAGRSVNSAETGRELMYNKENLKNPGFIVE